MSAAEMLDNLARQIYKPHLLKPREDLRSIPEVLRIPILIIDFDIEVHINGITRISGELYRPGKNNAANSTD